MISNNVKIKIRKPKIDFIGIGAPKAGTSWLYARLGELPDFDVLPIKELHYFNMNIEYPTPNKYSVSYITEHLRDLNWVKMVLKTLFHVIGNLKLTKWYFSWYFSKHNDDWYLSLFSSYDGLKGEITPGYSILKEKDIQRMKNLAPDVKLIFILRNPIERAWSQYRYSTRFMHNSNLKSLDIDPIIDYMNSDRQELRSNYFRTLENYSKVFPKDQILICFYDAIKDNPALFLKDIVSFIGGNKDNVLKYCNLISRDNVSKEIDMPHELLDFLKEKYHNQIKQLAKIYGGYCNKWYIDYYGKNLFKGEQPLMPTTAVQ